jgi:formate transporter
MSDTTIFLPLIPKSPRLHEATIMFTTSTHTLKDIKQPTKEISIDALVPAEMAVKAAETGVKKTALDTIRMFLLAILAGAFIAMGAIFATTVSAGGSVLPYGVSRLLAGVAFSLGLILVVVSGSELFTGNNLIIIAFANRRITLPALLRNWGVVYLGNFVGAILTAYLMFLTRQYTFGGGSVGLVALNTGEAKTGLVFAQAVVLGLFCNALVCMAVWMCYSARSTIDKILAIVPPIAAFVAAGFEHSIANMYFIPIAMFIKQMGSPAFFEAIQKTPADFPHLTWSNFFLVNLLPVTIGNVIGGVVMVGLMYWFIYLSKAKSAVATTEATQRIAAATARPEVPAPVFFVTREPPVRPLEVPIQAISGRAEGGESASPRL